MTRIADLVPDMPQHRAKSLAQASNSDRSFAERLESGEPARGQIASHALSFSEVGILGLHYANQANDAPPIPLAPKMILPQDQAQPWSAIERPVAVQASSYQPVPTSVAELPALHGKLSEPQPLSYMAHSSSAAEHVLAIGIPTESQCQATDIQPVLARSFRNLLAEKRPVARVSLSIKEMPGGITIICKGDVLDDEFLQDFSLVSQQTARDFGVTIRSLVVNGKKRPSFD